MGSAARNALAKIAAVLPSHLRESLEAAALLVGPGKVSDASGAGLASVRAAIKSERKVAIRYQDGGEVMSDRTIWPFALGFFDHVRVVVAWCELREDFRHFRTDRIDLFSVTEVRYPSRRQALLKAWQEAEGLAPPA